MNFSRSLAPLKRAFGALALLGTIALGAGGASAATFVVDRLDDVADSACSGAANDCSLRGAIARANADTSEISPDTINFSVAGRIRLLSALPTLAGTVTVSNTQSGAVTVSGDVDDDGFVFGGDANDVRVFTANGEDVRLNNLLIEDGTAAGGGVNSFGGGIDNRGSLTVSNCVLSGNNAFSGGGGIFNSGTLTLTDSTVDFNRARNNGGGILNSGTLNVARSRVNSGAAANGGGVFNSGTLSLSDSVMEGSAATNRGGGISNNGGTATLLRTALVFNSVNAQSSGGVEEGGGIYNAASLTATNCTLSNNSAEDFSGAGDGGAVFNIGSLTLSGCTLQGNLARNGTGGALLNRNTATLLNCELSDNSANDGGAIYSNTFAVQDGQPDPIPQTLVRNSTLSNNAANRGGALFNVGGLSVLGSSTIAGNGAATGAGVAATGNNSTRVRAGNSIIADNRASGGAAGTADSGSDVDFLGGAVNPFLSGGSNLIGDGNGAGAFAAAERGVTAAQVNLGPLRGNDGPTLTRALLAGSIAIDAGASDETTDQRGILRPQDGDGNGSAEDDIGAFEVRDLGPTSASSFIVTTLQDTTASDGLVSLREAIERANFDQSAASNDTITFAVSGTIRLLSALPTMGGAVTITNTQSGGVSVSGDGTGDGFSSDDVRVFVTDGTDVRLNNLSIVGGFFDSLDARASGRDGGGGISNRGTLTLTGCIIAGNTTSDGLFFDGGGIFNAGPLNIENCTLSNNSAQGDGGAIGIESGGALTLRNSTLNGNTAGDDGGAIGTGDDLTGATPVLIENCTLSGNAAGNSGGAIGIRDNVGANVNMTVRNCTLSGNTTDTGDGGGVFNDEGDLLLENCTLAGNTAGDDGGGLYSNNDPDDGTTILRNCTVSGNTADFAGGGVVNVDGPLVIQSSTISGNSAPPNRGAGVSSSSDERTVTQISNSIIAGNGGAAGTDVDVFNPATNSFQSNGFNLIGDGNATPAFNQPGDVTGNSDPGLAPLADNGGPTQTRALLAGSPAINAGSNALIPADTLDADGDGNTSEAAPFDQRGTGFARVVGASVDIGAFEAPSDPTPPSVVSIVRASANPTTSSSVSFTVTFSESVTGVDTSDFALTLTGDLSGATVTAVSGSGATYTVTASGIAGTGTLRLDLKSSGTGIADGASNALVGGFTLGETYTRNAGTGGTPATSGAIISEFRHRGTGGSGDEYIELYNTTGAPLQIGGWSVQTSAGTTSVPQNALVPARGHYLFAGGAYLLGNYGSGDALLSGDASDISGVALLNAAGELQDAAGFTTSDASLREGTPLASAPTANGQYAFMRRFQGQTPVDTGDNAADFLLLSTDGTTPAGTTLTAQLGAPNPEGLTSPNNVNAQIGVRVLDANFGPNVSPNRIRIGSGNGGSLVFRRIIKNNTGQPLSRIRLLVTDITGQVSPVVAGQADVRVTSQADENVAVAGQGTILVYGTTLEAPSNLPTGTGPTTVGGGGIGSSVNYGIVLTTPLQPNEERAYGFNVQVAKTGSFFVNINLLGK